VTPKCSGSGRLLSHPEAVDFVRTLKQEPGKDICLMGCGELARPLFEARLIDEIGFSTHPLLLGAGIPPFDPMSRQIDLELRECRPANSQSIDGPSASQVSPAGPPGCRGALARAVPELGERSGLPANVILALVGREGGCKSRP
jgi:hypothetical protein